MIIWDVPSIVVFRFRRRNRAMLVRNCYSWSMLWHFTRRVGLGCNIVSRSLMWDTLRFYFAECFAFDLGQILPGFQVILMVLHFFINYLFDILKLISFILSPLVNLCQLISKFLFIIQLHCNFLWFQIS